MYCCSWPAFNTIAETAILFHTPAAYLAEAAFYSCYKCQTRQTTHEEGSKHALLVVRSWEVTIQKKTSFRNVDIGAVVAETAFSGLWTSPWNLLPSTQRPME